MKKIFYIILYFLQIALLKMFIIIGTFLEKSKLLKVIFSNKNDVKFLEIHQQKVHLIMSSIYIEKKQTKRLN